MDQVTPNAVKPRQSVERPQFVVAKAEVPPMTDTAVPVVTVAQTATAPQTPIAVAKSASDEAAPAAIVKAAAPIPEPPAALKAPPIVAPAPAALAHTDPPLAAPSSAPAVRVAETQTQTPATPAPGGEAAAQWSVPGLVALAKGDLSTARLFLTRAAEAGDARAWMALADTYDPAMLQKLGVVGAPGDPQRARDYLGKAAAAGIVSARDRMAALAQNADAVH